MERILIAAIVGVLLILAVSAIQLPPMPYPSFRWEPASPKAGQSIMFIPEVQDPRNVIVGYTWTFGDGTRSSRPFVEHQYHDPGSYRVCLTIRDNRGRTEQNCQTLFVREEANKPPVAAFHWQPFQPEVGQPVQFISDAVDPEGELVAHTWDLGDGTQENLASFSHTFRADGIYRVCLTVRDLKGLSDTTCQSIRVGRDKTEFIIPPMTQISRNDNLQPTWSPDGTKILFTSNRDGNWELYVIDVETKDVTRLTNNSALDFDPDWGPDGRIAFVSDRDNQAGTDIYILNYPSGGITRVTFDPGNLNKSPSWVAGTNAQSARIVYHTDLDGNREIYLRDPQTGNANRLTTSPADDWNPAVSPDGTRVAFQHWLNGRSQIFVMNIDGTHIKQLTFNAGENVYPTWSPDGKYIAFASNRDGNFKIYVIDPETGSERVLTMNTFNSTHPAWSPDGQRIAFASDRTGNWEIWIVNVDGQNVKRITGVSR